MSEEALLTNKTKLKAHYNTNDITEPNYIKKRSPRPPDESLKQNIVVETNDVKMSEPSSVSDSMANMGGDSCSSDEDIASATVSEFKAERPAVSMADVLPTNPIVQFDTSLGRIGFELFLSDCPVTVSHFVDLVKTNFYDYTHVHWVARSLMIRMGCPYSENPDSKFIGTGHAEPNSWFENLERYYIERRDSDGCIQDEFLIQRSNRYLTLALANRGVRHSGSSQFFINLDDNAYLDWFQNELCPDKHLVFGRVIWGEDVVRSIGRCKLKEDTLRPRKPIRVNAAIRTTIEEMKKPSKNRIRSRFSIHI